MAKVWGDKNALKWTLMWVAQLCVWTKKSLNCTLYLFINFGHTVQLVGSLVPKPGIEPSPWQ